MKDKKTLIILSPAFPENEAADYWVPSQQLMVKALKKNYPGLHVIVIALLYPYSCTRYTWNGVEVISFDGTHRRKLKRVRLWYEVWKKMGSPQNPTPDQIADLEKAGQLKTIGSEATIRLVKGQTVISTYLSRQGVSLFKLEWRDY